MNRTHTVTWQDPVPLAQAARSMSGIDFLRAVRDGRLPPAPIQQLIGMKLAEVEEGRVVWELTPGEQHYNPIGTVHAGITATMLDSAMACAVHSTLPVGKGYTTLEFKINLVRGVTMKAGTLRASAHLVHGGKSTATAEGRLEDASGALYAHASSTCIILG
ncbi:MAG: PaaI family thioesterase [Betaproteobacteria bacterium]|nr:PaaI family thioesterase [Betaproteobacteria bacterium]